MLTTRLHRCLVSSSTSSPLIPSLNLQQIPSWDYRPPISRISPFLPPSNASRTQPQSPMGSPTSNLNHYFFVFVFLFFFLSSLSCPISCDQTLDRSETNRPPGYRVFQVKNARPLYLINRRREVVLDGSRGRTERMMIKRKINKKVTGGDDSRSTRPFTVMLPKGFVPPSGSSPCHNENPNSAVTSYCELSNPKP